MSDDHRKDIATKVKETLTPDAMKSNTQKAEEGVTGIADRTVREAQPDHSKSTIQETFDKSGRAKDDVSAHGAHGTHGAHGAHGAHDTQGVTHESVGDKIKHAVGADKKDEHTTTI